MANWEGWEGWEGGKAGRGWGLGAGRLALTTGRRVGQECCRTVAWTRIDPWRANGGHSGGCALGRCWVEHLCLRRGKTRARLWVAPAAFWKCPQIARREASC